MAQHRNGTVTVENGSPYVDGVGTGWQALVADGKLLPGHMFHLPNDPARVPYTIAAFVPGQERLQLTVPYAGTNAAGVKCAITYGWSPNADLYLPDPSDVDIVMLIKHGVIAKIDGWLGTGGAGHMVEFGGNLLQQRSVLSVAGGATVADSGGKTVLTVHGHGNGSVLDDLGDEEGVLQYKGQPIQGGGGGAPSIHASRHLSGGADPIPLATSSADGLMSKAAWASVKGMPPAAFMAAFPVVDTYRAWQGVCSDGDYIYVMTDRDDSFGLSNIIQRYDMQGTFVSEVALARIEDSAGRFMSAGSGAIINDELWVPVYNINDGGPAPYESKIVRLNKTTLAVIGTHDLPNGGVCEGIWLHSDGYYYTCYHDILKIRRFSFSGSAFFQDAEYSLTTPTYMPYGYYQGLFFMAGDLYVNGHGPNSLDGSYSSLYSPGVDRYSFSGGVFTFEENIPSPNFGAGQSCYPCAGRFYWNDRPGNQIIVTPRLNNSPYQKLKINWLTVGDVLSSAPVTISSGVNLGASGTPTLVIQGSGNKERIQLRSSGAAGATGGFYMASASGGTEAEPTATQAHQYIGGFTGTGHDGAGWVVGSKAGVIVRAAADWDADSQSTYITFATTPIGSTVRTDWLRINHDGVIEALPGATFQGEGFLPNQAGGNGKYLQTNGTTASWVTPPYMSNPMTTIGDLIYSTYSAGQPLLSRLGIGNPGQVLTVVDVGGQAPQPRWQSPLGGVAGSDKQVQFNNGGTLAGASDAYWDETNDRLSLGRTDPQSRVYIEGATGTQALQIIRTHAATTGVTSMGGGLNLYHNDASNGLPVSGARTGYVASGSFGTNGTTTYNAAVISFYTTEAWSSTQRGEEIRLETTATGGTTRVARVIIPQGGAALKIGQSADCVTGAGTPTLGTNCPATTLTAPYKWLRMMTDDGAVVYLPAWK